MSGTDSYGTDSIPIPAATAAAIRRRRRAGYRLDAIAREYGLDVAAVRAVIGPTSAAQRRAMCELRAAGWSLEAIGRRYGLSGSRVCQITRSDPATIDQYQATRSAERESRRLQQADDRRRDQEARDRAHAELEAQIRQLRSAGWSVRALASRFGLSLGTISKLAPTGRPDPARLDAPPTPPAPLDTSAPGTPDAPVPAIAAAQLPPGTDPAAAFPARARGLYRWGWYAPAVGSAHGRALLNEDLVAELRRLRARNPRRWTHRALAARYRITRGNVAAILEGRTWRHVPMA